MKQDISRRALLPVATGIGWGAVGLFAGSAPAQTNPQPLTDTPPTVLTPGVHRVDTNLTIRGDLMVPSGTTIEIAAGRTLTLLGSFMAPVAHIFTGAGKVDLNRSRMVEAHPEWWGAAPGDSRQDSLSALTACLAAHPVMRLLAADYFISATLAVERSFCRIIGSGFRGTEQGQGTRLIVTGGRADVLRVGPASRPKMVNDFLQNIDIRGIALARSVAPDTSGGAQPAGLRAQFLLFGRIDDVSAAEHAVGFVARGLVRTTFTNCIAFRSVPGRQDNQYWRGFLLDGSADIGLAGGNASLSLIECNASIGGEPKVEDGVGLLLDGAFADSFVLGFETTGIATGIRVDGRADALATRGRNGHVNLHLTMPIIDQCGTIGIEIRNTSTHAMIDITEPYVAVAPSADAAMRFDRMRGAVTLTGGQCVGNMNMAAKGDAAGLEALDSHGLQVTGLKILEHSRPVVVTRCEGLSLRLLIANPSSRPGGDAISVSNCTAGTIAPLISGQDGAFATGVRFVGRSAQMHVDASGIMPAALEGNRQRVMNGDRALSLPSREAYITVDGI
ncbi:hypothetical protein [Sphingomonas fuzhouensis]|uniref:hypothetical protein n=1 Tax=Sphingomonas fuzhouensis TaxID=3106033 RepID=UPI002AFE4353|nr:hypothetical protein [Sphingomonas sp. SGZ-02]